jgi:phage N-6-adenine-methyltransferase
MSVTDNKFTVLFSSKTGEHITPIKLYKELDEFQFRLDPCTTKNNPLGTPNFYTKENDGLKQSWAPGPVYVNPPYGRDVSKWVEKACWEAKDGSTVVMLLPARTDTKWFQNLH